MCRAFKRNPLTPVDKFSKEHYKVCRAFKRNPLTPFGAGSILLIAVCRAFKRNPLTPPGSFENITVTVCRAFKRNPLTPCLFKVTDSAFVIWVLHFKKCPPKPKTPSHFCIFAAASVKAK